VVFGLNGFMNAQRLLRRRFTLLKPCVLLGYFFLNFLLNLIASASVWPFASSIWPVSLAWLGKCINLPSQSRFSTGLIFPRTAERLLFLKQCMRWKYVQFPLGIRPQKAPVVIMAIWLAGALGRGGKVKVNPAFKKRPFLEITIQIQ